MPTVRCTRCNSTYPADGAPFRCTVCGGIYDYDAPPCFDPPGSDRSLPGMWRFRSTFALPDGAEPVSLGEGSTPLIPVTLDGHLAWLKLESLNPTGSYKDRGSAVLLSQLAVRNVSYAVEDSSGNAGASFAAYAARAGLRARVFVPESASGPKRNQIEAYGAELVRVPGPRSAAAEAVLQEAGQGAAYASHAYLPFGILGIATIAYEIVEQLGEAPGTVIAPVGHGGLFLGILRGFQALLAAGQIERMPYLMGVQAGVCAPVWRGFLNGAQAMLETEEGPTVAEGVRVRRPVRAQAIFQELDRSNGDIVAVAEEDILPAYRALARLGIHVEPTAALTWAAWQNRSVNLPAPQVLILSGAGLKYQPST